MKKPNDLCREMSSLGRIILVALMGVLVAPAVFGDSPEDWFIASDKAKKGYLKLGPYQFGEFAPARIPSGGGSQTERLPPSSPDFLLGKLKWAEAATIGDNLTQDWNLAPNDMLEFHKKARSHDFKYMPTQTAIQDFSFDPALMPSILLSGVRELNISPDAIDKLRKYVLDGGMIVCDSVYGSPWFYESAKKLFDDMFPEERFRKLPPDHPLFHMVVDIDTATYHAGGKEQNGKPFMEGLYVGSRVGVLVSKYGLGCGLQGNMDVFKKLKAKGLKPLAYSQETAQLIGENLALYIIGYSRVGEAEGRAELFGKVDKDAPTSKFTFAQVKHGGGWNAHPVAARQLLMQLAKDSAIPVNLKRVLVDLERDDIDAYPFLFFTGLDDFVLTDKQIDALRKHVARGGTLVVNNALGLATFHQAAVREIRRAFPESELELLPQTHEIFSNLNTIKAVKYTPKLQKDAGEQLKGRPVLFGAKNGDRHFLIYSPYDIEGGWNEVRHPLSLGYQSASAMQLGCNLIMYAMEH